MTTDETINGPRDDNSTISPRSRICKKCHIEKAIGSFPKRSGRNAHLRELSCGMCKKRAKIARHPEKYRIAKALEDVRRRVVLNGIPAENYIDHRRAMTALIADRLPRIRKARRRCPLLSAYPKIEYQINREFYLEKSRQWGKRNPDKALAKKQRRRVRIAGCPSILSLDEWNQIKARFGYKCAYCGNKPRVLSRDHVIPLFHGGDDSPQNVVPACRPCNSRKRTGPPPKPVQTALFA